MVIHRPDFIVIGAMKSATTTLHEQLARQPGLFMSRPKEPNFFSDNENYARGWGWYSSLFRAAGRGGSLRRIKHTLLQASDLSAYRRSNGPRPAAPQVDLLDPPPDRSTDITIRP